jgi:hypothetical protein
MAVNAARRSRRRVAASTPKTIGGPVETLAIGEIDQTVFDCPSCGRPLAMGARRCPGCGTHLAMGVPVAKAFVFVLVGLMVGFLAGGGAGLAVGFSRPAAMTVTSPAGVLPSAAPAASSATGATSGPVASAAVAPSAAPTDGAAGLPISIQAAITQAGTMNQRFFGDGSSLSAALASGSFDASAVAETLRSISADTLYASQVAQRVSTWPDTMAIGSDLGTAYARIHEIAENALLASVHDTAAYRQAARDTLTELSALRTIAGRLADLATVDGVTLPGPSSAP